MTLKPIQAIALTEIGLYRGGLLPIRVGGGKTLISLLAPRVTGALRPLLMLPAHLRDKTRDEMRAYRRHWHLPALHRIESYQMLSRVSGAALLTEYAPDHIFADETHYLKNPNAACTKRTARYMRANRSTAFVVASGTITKRSVKDFAHLANWSLGRTAPIPADHNALDEWSRALDVGVQNARRLAPGALSELGPGPVRQEYQRRLVETPGVIATQEGPLPIELTIKSHAVDLDPVLETAYENLRADGVTPDGWLCPDGIAIWRHARELSTGFYSIWDPRPPDDWADARRDWGAECRELIKTNRRQLDTELQVRRAVADTPAHEVRYSCDPDDPVEGCEGPCLGHARKVPASPSLYPHALPALRRWQRLRPTFEPNSVPVWVSDRTIDWIASWAKANGPALIWTDRPAVGRRLAELHGLPYYGQLGIDERTGRYVEKHRPHEGSAVLSIDANSVGRNLQRWSRNLVIDVAPNGSKWEQMLGRTHRDGQQAEEVTVDVLFGCVEDVTSFWRGLEDSQYAEEMTGQAQKLVHANLEGVESVQEAGQRSGAQWNKIT